MRNGTGHALRHSLASFFRRKCKARAAYQGRRRKRKTSNKTGGPLFFGAGSRNHAFHSRQNRRKPVSRADRILCRLWIR
jgi:hypothetical protein